MNIKIKKLHPNAIVPTYGTAGAAAFDLYACDVGEGWNRTYGTYIERGESVEVDTGLAFEIPDGYAMFIYSRSGHGFVDDVRLANCVGVIDSDYRGPVKVKLTADVGSGGFGVRVGDRIAQAVVLPVPRVEFEVVDTLAPTARDTGGFGSTGK